MGQEQDKNSSSRTPQANAFAVQHAAAASAQKPPAQFRAVENADAGSGLLGDFSGQAHLPFQPPVQKNNTGTVAQLARAADLNAWNVALAARTLQATNAQQQINTLITNGLQLATTRAARGQIANKQTLFRNTCESIRDGRMTINVLTQSLSCHLTPHNYTEWAIGGLFYNRVPESARNGNLFFDSQVIYPNTGVDQTAAAGLNENHHNNFKRQGSEPAHTDGRQVRIFMPDGASWLNNNDILQTIIIHEGQHAIDRHNAALPGNFAEASMDDATGDRAVGDVANRYRTEFRAYWIGEKPGGNFGSATRRALNDRSPEAVDRDDPMGNAYQSQATSFENERQENIFWHLVNTSYKWVGTNYVYSKAFRDMVNSYTKPSGGNLLNSTRIDAFAGSLNFNKGTVVRIARADKPGRREEFLGQLKDLRKTFRPFAMALDENDRSFLSSPLLSQAFWRFFDAVFPPLGDEVLDLYHQKTKTILKRNMNID